MPSSTVSSSATSTNVASNGASSNVVITEATATPSCTTATTTTQKPTVAEPRDIEAQMISPAPPVYGYPVRDATVVDVVGSELPTRIIYVTEPPYPAVAAEGYAANDPHPELLTCAMVGFLFSWIPLIGIATYLVNMNAPRGSPRHTFAQSACCITTFVLLFNMIFWTAWGY